jgi:nicotinamide-nucleotide amidase
MAASDAELNRLAMRLARSLIARRMYVTTAESCTGGWIAKVLTDISGSSGWFAEGFITYSNDAKRIRLGVLARVLRAHGAVSRATAEAMVVGALRQARAQVAVAVTGIAGPAGAVPGKRVGTVWLAWAVRSGRGIKKTAQLRHFRGGRDAVRRNTVRAALQGLLKL